MLEECNRDDQRYDETTVGEDPEEPLELSKAMKYWINSRPTNMAPSEEQVYREEPDVPVAPTNPHVHVAKPTGHRGHTPHMGLDAFWTSPNPQFMDLTGIPYSHSQENK